MAIILIRKVYIILPLVLSGLFSFGQKVKEPLVQGNNFYKEKDYQKSAEAYNKALKLAPANPLANYNMGNTQFRLNKFEDATSLYDNAIANSRNKSEKEKSFYNKGVSLSRQQKLEESIAAYKEALKLNPKDQEARENLQKALLEKKQQDQDNKQQQDKNKDKDKKKQDKQNNQNNQPKDDKEQDQQKKPNEDKEQDQQKKPDEQQSKLTKQQVEQLLKALAQKEKEVQQKLRNKEKEKEKEKYYQSPEKDW